MPEKSILDITPLGMPWATVDPFLFCVFHADTFPKANEDMTPAAPLTGRMIGQDFENIDGWNMYHGETVPGFPQHPHRGFETVTVVRKGLVDHSDSLGATARYGDGDTQWLTTGRGISHTEMFPLLNTQGPNPVELFQIWLNLPPGKKMAEPRFNILWGPKIPVIKAEGAEITVIAGSVDGKQAPPPPPDSWASQPKSEVAIWTIRLAKGASWTLPAGKPGLNRAVYYYRGKSLSIEGEGLKVGHRALVASDRAIKLEAGETDGEILMLQGRPIGAPVANYGPFVMNTQTELRQAFEDYQRTQFGGWPWPSNDPVHPKNAGRFAQFPDGRKENPF